MFKQFESAISVITGLDPVIQSHKRRVISPRRRAAAGLPDQVRQ
jgi:hypothetical protein